MEATDRVFRARTVKVPGHYLVESIAIGDLVRPERALFASAVESITDLGVTVILHLANGADLHQVVGQVVEVVGTDAADSILIRSRKPVDMTPLIPQPWDCRTPSGHWFSVSFSSAEQRDAVEAHWLDRHDYCRTCEDCDGCRHPDCGTCACD